MLFNGGEWTLLGFGVLMSVVFLFCVVKAVKANNSYDRESWVLGSILPFLLALALIGTAFGSGASHAQTVQAEHNLRAELKNGSVLWVDTTTGIARVEVDGCTFDASIESRNGKWVFVLAGDGREISSHDVHSLVQAVGCSK